MTQQAAVESISEPGALAGQRNAQQAESDWNHSRLQHIEPLRCGVAKINNPPPAVRPAVIYPDYYRASVSEVLDQHLRTKAQGAVRRGERVHVEALAAGRRPAVVLPAVPGRRPRLGSAQLRRRTPGDRAGRHDQSAEQRQPPQGRYRRPAASIISLWQRRHGGIVHASRPAPKPRTWPARGPRPQRVAAARGGRSPA